MNELVIQKRNFEIQKNKLKEFSKKMPASLELPKTEIDGGLFGWFDHKVTGAEVNKLVHSIQGHLKSSNQNVSSIIKEFTEIYNTFEQLDKEYLQGIIVGVKAAEKASNQANDAAIKAQINTEDIRKLIDIQKITIDELLKFKEKFDKFEYIHDLEINYDYIQNFNEKIALLELKIIKQEKDITKKINIAFIISVAFGATTLTFIILYMLGIL